MLELYNDKLLDLFIKPGTHSDVSDIRKNIFTISHREKIINKVTLVVS